MPTVSVKKIGNNGRPTPENEGQFSCNDGAVLWEALDNQGLKLPHGCLSGSCAACRVEVISGENLLAPMGPTESMTIERFKTNYQRRPNAQNLEGKTIRLSCQAKIQGDGEIEVVPFD